MNELPAVASADAFAMLPVNDALGEAIRMLEGGEKVSPVQIEALKDRHQRGTTFEEGITAIATHIISEARASWADCNDEEEEADPVALADYCEEMLHQMKQDIYDKILDQVDEQLIKA